jgi:hypothetical protein
MFELVFSLRRLSLRGCTLHQPNVPSDTVDIISSHQYLLLSCPLINHLLMLAPLQMPISFIEISPQSAIDITILIMLDSNAAHILGLVPHTHPSS